MASASVEQQPLLAQETEPAEPASGWSALQSDPTQGWEDPDDTVGLLDEDGAAAETGATIFKPEAEQQELDQVQSAMDPRLVLKQFLLCSTLVAITIYEAIFKAKAVRVATFDFTSLMIMQAVISIVIALMLTAKDGTLEVLLGGEGFIPRKAFWWNLLKFSPPGVLFAFAVYVSMITMVYLSPDVFKVLEQTRLLVMGILCYFLMRKKLSTSSWVALVAITLTCLTYGRMKTAESDAQSMRVEMGKNVVRSEQLELHFTMPETGDRAAVAEVGQVMHVLEEAKAMAHSQAKELLQSLKKMKDGGSLNESKNPALGFLLTAVFVMMSCFAGVYSEIVLKKDKHMPFYIQKIFLEIPGGLFSVFASFVVRPLLMNNGIAKEKLSISFAELGLFYGWDNWLVPTLFCLVLCKSWLSGIICKQLSAISKQLCSIVAVVMLYFFILMHTDCPEDSFMCPGGITKASFNIIIIDLAVLCSVISYTTALRDKQRKQMFKAKLKEIQ